MFLEPNLCGDGNPTPAQLDVYKTGYEFIQQSMDLFRPGMTYQEISEKAYQFPEKYKAQRYPVMSHGAGMSDEWPAISYPDWRPHGFGHEPGALEEKYGRDPGMLRGRGRGTGRRPSSGSR